jgi:hypothetical protein
VLKRYGVPPFAEAALVGCPAGRVELAGFGTPVDGKPIDGTGLAPWREGLEARPLRSARLSVAGGAVERVLIHTSPRELDAGVELYLRLLGPPAAYAADFKRATEQVQPLVSRAPQQNEAVTDRLLLRLLPACNASIVAFSGLQTRDLGTWRIAHAEPVIYLGRLTLKERELNLVPDADRSAQLSEALVAGACESLPDMCGLRRRAAVARRPTRPEAPGAPGAQRQ